MNDGWKFLLKLILLQKKSEIQYMLESIIKTKEFERCY